ncbi:hypothetical protein [Arthrobacter sp. JCM 19049]|uniref:hypothetical protein n=1 Tax=Arthrobacter sp. JCM 19049 TaxID=1460643 RepID=UPI0006D0160B|nr:hypothetical protein [Arthrobacter sp. JCM 19049]
MWVFTHHELPSTPGADLTFVRGDIDLWSQDIARSAGQQDVWILGGAQLAGRFLTAGCSMSCSCLPSRWSWAAG